MAKRWSDRLDRAGYAVASGAACSSANPEPSHVLRAMGVSIPNWHAARCVSASVRGNSEEQVAGFPEYAAGHRFPAAAAERDGRLRAPEESTNRSTI
jgi:hypothetical protein